MAECPFCGNAIDEHLAVHGGSCPHCFGQIPGEDAPTDPGAAARARLEAADRKKVARSRVPALIVALAVVSVVATAALVVLTPEPTAPVIDFDELELSFPGEIQAWVEPEPEPEVARPRPRPRPGSALEQLLVQDDPAIGGVQAEPSVAGGPRGPREIGGLTQDIDPTRPSVGVSVGSGVSAGELSMIPQRRRIRGEPLSDPDAIVEMLKAAMQDGIPGLRPCYERSLRANASLQGSWMLEFQVSPDGVAERIQVRGDEMSDAEMESCIAQKVQEWFFQPVVEAQPVRKTLRFRPT